MIFAKLNNTLKVVTEFPLSETDIRRSYKLASLPSKLTNQNLPRQYTIIHTIDKKPIDPMYLVVLKNKELTFLKDELLDLWYIKTTSADLGELAKSNKPTVELNDIKKRKLKELVVYIDTFVENMTNSYRTPNAEIQTWNMQFTEALAWSLDPEVNTPTLDIIASSRGIEPNTLKAKALEKALTYQASISYVIGKKQYFEDLIDKADSVSDVNDINFHISKEELLETVNNSL